MTEGKRATGRNGSDAPRGFADESSMVGPLAEVLRRVCKESGGTWVLLDEHHIAGRIPDFVIGRVDLAALRERIEGGWERSLGPSEVRVLRLLRPDRGATTKWLARRLGVTPNHARKVLLKLVVSGFIRKADSGSYVRAAPIRPILDRLITFELKRSDWREALIQARAHLAYADRAYVVFDEAYESRFLSAKEDFRRLGVGLIALSAATDTYRRYLEGKRSPLRNLTAVMLAAERALARLLGQASTQLPQARLPNASGRSGRQGEPVLVGQHSRTIRQLLGAGVH